MNASQSVLKISLLFIAITVAMTGCTAMAPFGQKQIPTESAAANGQYQVVKVSPMGSGETYTGSVTKQTTVQSALEAAGAIKQFGAVTVDLHRMVPESGQMLKLACEFQPGKKMIKFEQDYQVLSGDRIIVTADGASLDKFFGR